MSNPGSKDGLVTNIRGGRTRRTAQDAAHLLGMFTEMPEPSPEELRQIHMVHAVCHTVKGGGYPPPASPDAGIDGSDRQPHRAVESITTPNSPVIHAHVPEFPHVFVDSLSANVPVTAAKRGIERGHGLERQYAVYLDSESDSNNDHGAADTFNLEKMLTHLADRYPNTNFQQYEVALRSKGITFLDVAVQFSTDWYIDPAKIGMSDGEATFFREWAMKEMVKRERQKREHREVWRAGDKKRARMSSPEDEEGNESIPPITSSSQIA